ncbi:MAG: dCTP deaminase [Actinobacteria bacterium]|nr:dCTP deaminase [Actinomycetota bacterium]
MEGRRSPWDDRLDLLTASGGRPELGAHLELKAEIEAGRLVFDPPLPKPAIQSASIDLSLHDVFWRPKPAIEGIIDIDRAQAYAYLDELRADSIELKPGDFVLGETREGVSLPQHLAGWIEGKSGRARHGIIVHCTAPHIAPGWGTPKPKRITLEFVNLGKAEIRLRTRIAIAQLLVTRLGSPSLVQYSGRHLDMGT